MKNTSNVVILNAQTKDGQNWCDIELRKPAYHEAGHAVIARLTGFEVAWVSIDPTFIRSDPLAINNRCDHGDPVCMTLSAFRINPIINKKAPLNKHEKETVISYCMHVLAGPIVECKLDPSRFDARYSMNDRNQVMAVLNHAEPNTAARKKLLDMARRKLNKAVEEHWSAISEVAAALQDRGTLTARELDELLQIPAVQMAA